MIAGRCRRCPVEIGYQCPGENAEVLCRHAESRPGYDAVLWAHARPRADVERERLGLAEAVGLGRRMTACPYRSIDPGCGCSGGNCGLRSARKSVTHLDCFACLRTYG